MQIDLIKQLEELIKSFGIQMLHFGKQMDPEALCMEFDQGLRKFLDYPYGIREGIDAMEEHYEEKKLYLIRDSFEEYYMSFLIPEEYCRSQGKEFIQIGPYIMKEPDPIAEKIIERYQLPIYLMKELKEYYYSIPFLSDSDAMLGVVLTQMGYLYQDREGLQIVRIEDSDRLREPLRKESWEDEDRLSVAAVEERYHYEEMMLDAIRVGDMEKVTKISRDFKHYRLKPRSEDTLRNTKNLMVVWNTLFRKAVQQADVHPVYIDRISENFAKQIENCAHVTELADLSRAMTRKYCLLVRNHSMKGYSRMIRDVLNYIDFHIREPLSLKSVSEQVNISPNYLSAQFKKETGKTLTDYMNEKRIHDSLILLTTTDLPIQEVAARVGIYDENYYARLFKKYQGQTAKQYRNMMRMRP